MKKVTASRTIRFELSDIRDIDRFLESNEIFDFSTLTRVAIRNFIQDPRIEITGVDIEGTKRPPYPQQGEHE